MGTPSQPVHPLPIEQGVADGTLSSAQNAAPDDLAQQNESTDLPPLEAATGVLGDLISELPDDTYGVAEPSQDALPDATFPSVATSTSTNDSLSTEQQIEEKRAHRQEELRAQQAAQRKIVLGVWVVLAVAMAGIGWYLFAPAKAQKVVDTRTAEMRKITQSGVVFSRDVSEGEFVVVNVQFSKAFLREYEPEKEAITLQCKDFKLLADTGEYEPEWILVGTPRASSLEFPSVLPHTEYIGNILPCCGNIQTHATGTFTTTRKPGGGTTTSGSLNVDVSGDFSGKLTVSTRTKFERGAGMQNTGYSAHGNVEGKLKDGTSLQFAYQGTSSVVKWNGPWKGQLQSPFTVVKIVEGLFVKDTVKIPVVFVRPPASSRLELQYRDAPPLTLPINLCR